MSYHRSEITRSGHEHAMSVCCNTDGPSAATVAIVVGHSGLTSTLGMTPSRARFLAAALNEAANFADDDRTSRAEQQAKKRKVAA